MTTKKPDQPLTILDAAVTVTDGLARLLPVSSSIDNYCRRHDISASFFYEQKALGLMPRVVYFSERCGRILHEDELAHIEKLKAEADNKAGAK